MIDRPNAVRNNTVFLAAALAVATLLGILLPADAVGSRWLDGAILFLGGSAFFFAALQANRTLAGNILETHGAKLQNKADIVRLTAKSVLADLDRTFVRSAHSPGDVKETQSQFDAAHRHFGPWLRGLDQLDLDGLASADLPETPAELSDRYIHERLGELHTILAAYRQLHGQFQKLGKVQERSGWEEALIMFLPGQISLAIAISLFKIINATN
ncbi:MAG: hypothetical protein QNJ44_04790 [Rhodobacter sp.]|nr:hypothetical protein [Rhodobacter sp.]